MRKERVKSLAIATLNSHIADALELQSKYNSAYLVFGKTSPWVDEENPPEESADVSAISEVIGYKKAKRFSLARPLRTGETAESVSYPVITYRSQVWVLVPTDKAYEEKARWVYFEAEILETDFPANQFRQVGVQIGLKPRSNVTKDNLLPSEVADTGVLKLYENKLSQRNGTDVYVREQFMIKIGK
jgi:hypothetical protein